MDEQMMNSNSEQDSNDVFEMVSFFTNYAGEYYIDPDKAGDSAEKMRDIKHRGDSALKKFINLGETITTTIPEELVIISCNGWLSNEQLVNDCFTISMKNKKYEKYPNIIQLTFQKSKTYEYAFSFRFSTYLDLKSVERDRARDYLEYMRSPDWFFEAYDDKGLVVETKVGNPTNKIFEHKDITKIKLCVDIPGSMKEIGKTYSSYGLFGWARDFLDINEDIIQLEDWWPTLSEYDPDITASAYIKLFTTERIIRRSWLEALYEFYMMPDQVGTCKQLGDRYGYAPSHYISYLSSAAINIANETGCSLPSNEKNSKYWPVLFQGKPTTDKSQGSYIWRMREPVKEAIEMLIDEGIFEDGKHDDTIQFDHNLILYGPPGTGKTYYSAIYAVAICDNKSVEEVANDPHDEVLERYRELKEEGRIAFTTFHQSYGYEEFIEGIKPKLNIDSDSIGYTIEDGVFKEFCNKANKIKVQSTSYLNIKSNPHIWGILLGGTGVTDLKRYCFENNVIRFGWDHIPDSVFVEEYPDVDTVDKFAKHQITIFNYSMEVGDIVIVARSITTIDAIGVITGDYEYDHSKDIYCRTRKVNWLVKDIEIDILPFLPNGRKQLPTSYLYPFDYIGIDNVSKIVDEFNDGSGVYFEHETKPYVFIIDEINRGNISKIFGELITLIEDTKRAGASEAMEATLPYSGEAFFVPNNVFILGTMNTADRSIALMDTALRRRFKFVEMMPNSEVLNSLGIGTIMIEGELLNVAKMLDIINKRIEYLFDREHTIGHAFFTKLADDPSLETLANIFEKNVIPLLQEYFYEDYEKIQLVLGDDSKADEFKFILDRTIKAENIFNSNPDIDLPEKGYSVQHKAFRRLESYKLIAKGL